MITFKGKSDHNPRSMRGGSGNRKEEAEESQRSRKTPKRRGTGKPLKSGKIRLAGRSEGNVRDSLCIVLRVLKRNLSRILKTAQENET